MNPTPLTHSEQGLRLRRRDLALAAAGVAAAVAVPATVAGQPAAAATGPEPEAGDWHDDTVRLATIGAVQTGGLLNQLLAAFQAQHPYQVLTSVGPVPQLFQQARDGQADLVATHFGVAELPDAVRDRVVRFPQLVVSTVFTFVAAPDDPAGIAAATGAVDAFARIAATQSPFVANNLGNPLFVTDTLWHAAGAPDKTGWYVDNGLSGPMAVQAASQLGGYTLWGLHPFLAFQQQQPTDMQAVPFDDSALQRSVATAVVRPGWTRRVNLRGALALERFLLEPATQGLIRAFRHPRFPRPIFWPAAHQNVHGESDE